MRMKWGIHVAMSAVILLTLTPFARATQITSGTVPVTVTLNASVVESISLSCTPSQVNFTGNAGTVAGDNPVSCTVSYVLNGQTRTFVYLAAYFTQAAALTGLNAGDVIQNQNILASFDGSAFTACNQSDGFSAEGCDPAQGWQIASSNQSASLWPTGTQTAGVRLEINMGAGVPVDTYTGTLNIVSYAP